jgi:hypothetical protein
MSPRAVASFVIGVLLTACSAAGPSASAESGAASALPSAAPPQASAASGLEGVWHTGVVTPDDAMAVLQAAGLQQYAQGFFDFWKIGDENVFTLRISGGRWACYWSKDGGLSTEEDSGPYSISGNTVTIRHDDAGGTDTHEWSVDGDTLTLTYLSDTISAPVPHGEEVFQRVLYMSSPWTRGTP